MIMKKHIPVNMLRADEIKGNDISRHAIPIDKLILSASARMRMCVCVCAYQHARLCVRLRFCLNLQKREDEGRKACDCSWEARGNAPSNTLGLFLARSFKVSNFPFDAATGTHTISQHMHTKSPSVESFLFANCRISVCVRKGFRRISDSTTFLSVQQ